MLVSTYIQIILSAKPDDLRQEKAKQAYLSCYYEHLSKGEHDTEKQYTLYQIIRFISK